MESIVVNACVCCSSRLRIDLCSILDTLESAVCRTSGKRAFRATVKQNWCVKETTTNSLHGGRTRDAVRYVHRSGSGRCGLPLPAGPRCSRWVCPDGFNGDASATRASPEGWRSCPARLQPHGQPSQQRPTTSVSCGRLRGAAEQC